MTPEEALTLYPRAVQVTAAAMWRQFWIHEVRTRTIQPWPDLPAWERAEWLRDAAAVIAALATHGLPPKEHHDQHHPADRLPRHRD